MSYKIFWLVISILVLTFLVYFPALYGGFLLDDYSNLAKINIFYNHEGLDGLIRYIINNESGALKRPISTLSFLLNANSWPANAFYFKLTNLLLHIFNGFLLFVVTAKILQSFNINKNQIGTIALINMSIWLLHPFFVSTTMYVVQRMSILPTLFVLMGIYFYLLGRQCILYNKKLGRLYMFISIFVCTLLAVLSKENGVILPVLILMLESLLLLHTKKVVFTKEEKIFFLVIPAAVVILAFIFKMPAFLESYKIREFSMLERFLTQSRVITEYLYHLFVPSYFTKGVYTDGYIISTSIFKPISTIYSFIFLSIISFLSFFLRRKFALLSFSLFFYFIAHFIESSVAPLEIYFEHRNYLPSLFLFLPLAIYFSSLIQRSKMFIIIPVGVVFSLAFLTNLSAKIWNNTSTMTIKTAEKFPQSFRAIERSYVDLISTEGVDKQVHSLLVNAISRNDNLAFRLRLLTLNCRLGKLGSNQVQELIKYMMLNKVEHVHKNTISGTLKSLMSGVCDKESFSIADKIIQTIKHNRGFQLESIQQTILYYEGLLYLQLDEVKNADQVFFKYLDLYKGYSDILTVINRYIAKGYTEQATVLINYMRKVIIDRNVQYGEKNYLLELDLLEKTID